MKLLTTTDAAREAGTTRQTIAANIRKGKLKASRLGKDWAVDADSLKQFIKSRAK